jgi:hypothetical protein
MLVRFSFGVAMALVSATCASGQATGTTPAPADKPREANWRPADSGGNAGSAAPALPKPAADAGEDAARVANAPRRPVTKVTTGTDSLPNGYGQVWREYDISPYTLRVTSTKRPEQAIVDWILRDTGYEAWHGEPLGILSATAKTLRVYHTPEMQTIVADVVDRFVQSEAETHTFSLHVVTVDNPSWRATAQPLLRPIPVQTPGIGAWVIEKEDRAMLVSELQRRTDYREHSSPHLMVNNGQSAVVSAMQGRDYIRDVALTPTVWPGFKAQVGRVDEGFALDFSPLLSADRQAIDATIKCNIDQVEKMVPVSLNVPVMANSRQLARIEVPQITQFRFHERFRWPIDKVLLVSMGMVALPMPVDAKPKELVLGIPMPGPKTAPRADLLVFVEATSVVQQATRTAGQPDTDAKRYRGRY